MKKGLHPKYTEMKAICSCGNVVETRSTIGRDINIDVCSQCHPFYTGKQKVIDTAGRVDRFMQKFGKQEAANKAAQASEAAAEKKASPAVSKKEKAEKAPSKPKAKKEKVKEEE